MAVALRSGVRRTFLLLPVLLLTVLACAEQTDIVEPNEVELRIDVDAEGVLATWALLEPDGTMMKGAGDSTLTGLVPGDYRLLWEPVEAYDSPSENPVRRTLKKGSSETLEGSYARIQGYTADLSLDPRPRNLQASWTVTGPRDFYTEGKGRGVMKKRSVGTYTVVWGEVKGHQTPEPSVVTLDNNDSIELGVTYQEADSPDRPRLVTIVVDPEPNELEAPWEIVAEDGEVYSGRGDVTLADIPVSVFTLTWGEVEGYETPQPNPVTIDPDAGQSTIVIGR